LEFLCADYFSNRTKINLISTTVQEIHILNRQYRNQDTPTDVLSFPTQLDNSKGGDVYICVNEVAANAAILNVSYKEELLRTAVHGILHLAGYTHKGKLGESEEEMFRLQESLLKKIRE
jgi:probable rRNA maturation factor